MNQTIAPPAPAQTALFDLMARSWRLDAPVAGVTLDSAGKTAAFALADGRLALMPLADPESAILRLRMEADSGRATIRPRERPVAPPVLTEALAQGAPMVAASGQIGFLVAARDGRLHRVTPRGQVIALSREARPIGALASDGRGRLALAREDKVMLHAEEQMEKLCAVLTSGPATALAFSPDGQDLAVAQDDSLLLWQPGQGSDILPLAGAAALQFSQTGAWLAGGDATGLWLLRRADRRLARIGNFRAAPVSLGFCTGAVFASGAFRLAGWSLDTPPFDDEATGALRSGRPGLVLVERVATFPARDLVAFGLADGGVAITQAGRADELPLRQADGAAITALAWSADGTALAIGTARGDAALLTLPPQLFK